MSVFSKAMVWTAVPIVVPSLVIAISVRNAATKYNEISLGMVMGLLWIVTALLLLGAIVFAIAFAIAGKKETAVGTLAGIGIGIVSLGVSGLTLFTAW